jgi:hypothetical protein
MKMLKDTPTETLMDCGRCGRWMNGETISWVGIQICLKIFTLKLHDGNLNFVMRGNKVTTFG